MYTPAYEDVSVAKHNRTRVVKFCPSKHQFSVKPVLAAITS